MSELAPWASDPRLSRGRRIAEPAQDPDDCYRSDRERIVHSTAFRRLVYKTQVFINHEGDLFRTRLTHSLEVAQLARSLARSLHLNEDLAEAISLAHDLGHTPFGHAGQDALHDCMRGHGGFEHNLQSLRVVDSLEVRYPGFDGLNLGFETREGILKHCSRSHAQRLEGKSPGDVGQRFLHHTQPSLEAQVVNLADEMAYNAHDIDDGVRSGLITSEQLLDVALYRRLHEQVVHDNPGMPGTPLARRLLFEVIRRMLSGMADDLVASTRGALQRHAPADAAAARLMPPLVAFSAPMRQACSELKQFLFSRLYRHAQVQLNTERAGQVVAELFAAYVAQPAQMPDDYAAQPLRERAVADYIAGMTDRFAVREHQRLSGRSPFGEGA
jgi:dGTPase